MKTLLTATLAVLSVPTLAAAQSTTSNANTSEASVQPSATPSPQAPLAETPQKRWVKTPNFSLQPYAQVQGWATYSFNRLAQTDSDAELDSVDPRMNIFFRRARLGFRGKPYENLSYTLSMFYDNAGHDSLAATRNATSPVTNNGRTSDATRTGATVGLWDFFLTWKMSSSDLYHLSVGYLRPQISRESLTAAFNVNSFEKAPSQNYIRQSVIGRGFGRATGINLGGQKLWEDFGLRYNAGIFNKVTTGDTFTSGTTDVTLGETQGSRNSLVYVGRAEVMFGDPEMDKYGMTLNVNYFGRRKGVTFGFNGSYQGRTPTYQGNRVYGLDTLINYGNLNIDGEIFLLGFKRNGADSFSEAHTGHVRVGYNFNLADGTVLEPTFMYSGFYGRPGSEFTGRDRVFDVGVNWYLDETRYKIYLHYVDQDGDGKNLEHRDGVYHYGDYAGLGVTLQI